MSRFLTKGMVAGLLACAAGLSIAFGKPALGAFLADENTAATVTAVAAGLASLAAGVLEGVRAKS